MNSKIVIVLLITIVICVGGSLFWAFPLTPTHNFTTSSLNFTENITPLEIEQNILEQVNIQRQLVSAPPLEWDQTISQIAALHSEDQVNMGIISHYGSNGLSAADRGVSAGYEICGDLETIQMYNELEALDDSFKTQLNDYNLQVTEYENKVLELNQRIADYNKDSASINNLQVNKDLILQKQYQNLLLESEKLSTEKALLDKKHSEFVTDDQAVQAKFDLVNQRIRDGWIGRGWGENIHKIQGDFTTQDAIDTTIQGWLDSPEHKQIMLNGHWSKSGVGIAIDGDLMIITEDFC